MSAPTVRQHQIQNAEYSHMPRYRCVINNHPECGCRAPMRLVVKGLNVLASGYSYLLCSNRLVNKLQVLEG